MTALTNAAYLLAAALFILGLRDLGSARTARRGNMLAALGMLIAIIVTLLDRQIVDFTFIVAGVVVGGAIGAVAARKVQMTAMPQMVAVFNGFGGGASALVAMAEYYRMPEGHLFPIHVSITLVLSLLIGAVTFTGSMIAYGKLQGIVKSAPVVYPLQTPVNFALLAGTLAVGAAFVAGYAGVPALLAVTAAASVLGVLLVIPIGGADMPVVISLLNSYSGLAAAMTGFVLSNNVLIVSGALVGASGIILTDIMCKAMNRSLTNVLFGRVGAQAKAGPAGEERHVVGYTAEDAAIVLERARSVIIVPGYGLAVAQAQHVLREMAGLLENKGVKVRYAIHPVAGRMPGHMNVLLAEANVPYDQLYEMDAINDDFRNTDVALVVGANDVVNPAARYKKDCPLYGMPILNVDQAQTVMIIKRSLSPGFAGVDNELFYEDKTMMLFGDAKEMLTNIVNELKHS